MNMRSVLHEMAVPSHFCLTCGEATQPSNRRLLCTAVLRAFWEYDIAHCENRSNNGHVTTLCNLGQLQGGRTRSCLPSQQKVSHSVTVAVLF